jgi:hypothetical protein
MLRMISMNAPNHPIRQQLAPPQELDHCSPFAKSPESGCLSSVASPMGNGMFAVVMRITGSDDRVTR